MKYVIGNWKANKNFSEMKQWVQTFLSFDFTEIEGKTTVIICPPYPFIPYIKENITGIPYLKVGSQDMSLYYQGAYTGEVTSNTLSGMVNYTLIGHSERRQYFNETQEILFNKVEHAKKNYIEPIFCVRGPEDAIAPDVNMVTYEPVFAIGTGQSDSIENILKVKQSLKLRDSVMFIYGGSVTDSNAREYLHNQDIDGVLPGGASLDPQRFYDIVLSSV